MPAPLFFSGRGVSGPLLFLIHGYPLDHRMWSEQVDGLAHVARVIAMDLPGFGRTAPVEEPVQIDDYAAFVLALADALGAERFVLGGLSMGGYVALAVARKAPSRLSGLILADTRADADSAEVRESRFQTRAQILAEGTSRLVDKMPGKLLSPTTRKNNPTVVEKVRDMAKDVSPVGAAAALLGMAQRPDARQELERIQVPTLVIVGEDDAITPPALAQEMAFAMKRAELLVVPKAGHLTALEAPGPVNTAILALLGRILC